MSPTTIAYVQAGGIVDGHVAGVVVAHDRALALFPSREATRSQYPLLAAMVVFTVGGLIMLPSRLHGHDEGAIGVTNYVHGAVLLG